MALREPDLVRPLALEAARCCICGTRDSEPVAVGEDFEYRTSPDSFLAVQCRRCGLVYLDPRPCLSELPRLYPDNYHAFDFSPVKFGLAYRVRRRLEAHRLMQQCRGLAEDAAILDIGCGDGFHLSLLREYGRPGWRLEGVDTDPRAIAAATARGIAVRQGAVEQMDYPEGGTDLALMIMTIEHVADPPAILRAVWRLLRPGGRLLLVTDNTASPDRHAFGSRHWGGYHFPRHWNLFDARAMQLLAGQTGFEVTRLRTIMSPVNWTYSVRNWLDDWGAPRGLVERFSLTSPGALALFTLFDLPFQWAGRGALLQAVLRRPVA